MAPPPLGPQRTKLPSGSQSSAGQRPVVVVPLPSVQAMKTSSQPAPSVVKSNTSSKEPAVSISQPQSVDWHTLSSQTRSTHPASRFYAMSQNGKKQGAIQAAAVAARSQKQPSPSGSDRTTPVPRLTEKDANARPTVSEPKFLTPSKMPSRWRTEKVKPPVHPTNDQATRTQQPPAVVNSPRRTRSSSGGRNAKASGASLTAPTSTAKDPLHRTTSTSAPISAGPSTQPTSKTTMLETAPSSTAPASFTAINARHGIRMDVGPEQTIDPGHPPEGNSQRANKRRRVIPDGDDAEPSTGPRDKSPGLFVTPDKPEKTRAAGSKAIDESEPSGGRPRFSSSKLKRPSKRRLSNDIEPADAGLDFPGAHRSLRAAKDTDEIRDSTDAGVSHRSKPVRDNERTKLSVNGAAPGTVNEQEQPSTSSEPKRNRKGHFSSQQQEKRSRPKPSLDQPANPGASANQPSVKHNPPSSAHATAMQALFAYARTQKPAPQSSSDPWLNSDVQAAVAKDCYVSGSASKQTSPVGASVSVRDAQRDSGPFSSKSAQNIGGKPALDPASTTSASNPGLMWQPPLDLMNTSEQDDSEIINTDERTKRRKRKRPHEQPDNSTGEDDPFVTTNNASPQNSMQPIEVNEDAEETITQTTKTKAKKTSRTNDGGRRLSVQFADNAASSQPPLQPTTSQLEADPSDEGSARKKRRKESSAEQVPSIEPVPTTEEDVHALVAQRFGTDADRTARPVFDFLERRIARWWKAAGKVATNPNKKPYWRAIKLVRGMRARAQELTASAPAPNEQQQQAQLDNGLPTNDALSMAAIEAEKARLTNISRLYKEEIAAVHMLKWTSVEQERDELNRRAEGARKARQKLHTAEELQRGEDEEDAAEKARHVLENARGQRSEHNGHIMDSTGMNLDADNGEDIAVHRQKRQLPEQHALADRSSFLDELRRQDERRAVIAQEEAEQNAAGQQSVAADAEEYPDIDELDHDQPSRTNEPSASGHEDQSNGDPGQSSYDFDDDFAPDHAGHELDEDDFHSTQQPDGPEARTSVETVDERANDHGPCEGEVRRQRSIASVNDYIEKLKAELGSVPVGIIGKKKRQRLLKHVADGERLLRELSRFQIIKIDTEGLARQHCTLDHFVKTLRREENELRRRIAMYKKDPTMSKGKKRQQTKHLVPEADTKREATQCLLTGTLKMHATRDARRADQMERRNTTAVVAAASQPNGIIDEDQGEDEEGHHDGHDDIDSYDDADNMLASDNYDSEYAEYRGGEQYFMSGALAVTRTEQQVTAPPDPAADNHNFSSPTSPAAPVAAAAESESQQLALAPNGSELGYMRREPPLSTRSSESPYSPPPLASTLTNDDPFTDFGVDSSRSTSKRASIERSSPVVSADHASDQPMADEGLAHPHGQTHRVSLQPYAVPESDPPQPPPLDQHRGTHDLDLLTDGGFPPTNVPPVLRALPPAAPTSKKPTTLHTLRQRILQIFQESTGLFTPLARTSPRKAIDLLSPQQVTNAEGGSKQTEEYVYLVCTKESEPATATVRTETVAQFSTSEEANNMSAAMMSAILESASGGRTEGSMQSEAAPQTPQLGHQPHSPRSGVSHATFGRRLSSIVPLSDQQQPLDDDSNVPITTPRSPPSPSVRDGKQVSNGRSHDRRIPFQPASLRKSPHKTIVVNMSDSEQEGSGRLREVVQSKKNRGQTSSPHSAVAEAGLDSNASPIKPIEKPAKLGNRAHESRASHLSPELGPSSASRSKTGRAQRDPFEIPTSDVPALADENDHEDVMDTTIELPPHLPSNEPRASQLNLDATSHGTNQAASNFSQKPTYDSAASTNDPARQWQQERRETHQKISVTNRKGMLNFKLVDYRRRRSTSIKSTTIGTDTAGGQPVDQPSNHADTLASDSDSNSDSNPESDEDEPATSDQNSSYQEQT